MTVEEKIEIRVAIDDALAFVFKAKMPMCYKALLIVKNSVINNELNYWGAIASINKILGE